MRVTILGAGAGGGGVEEGEKGRRGSYVDFSGAFLYNHFLPRRNFDWNLGIIATSLNPWWRAQVVNSVDRFFLPHLGPLESGL